MTSDCARARLLSAQIVLVSYSQSYSFGFHRCTGGNNARGLLYPLYPSRPLWLFCVTCAWGGKLFTSMLSGKFVAGDTSRVSRKKPMKPEPLRTYLHVVTDPHPSHCFGKRCATFIVVIWGFPARRPVKRCRRLVASFPHLWKLPPSRTESLQSKQELKTPFPVSIKEKNKVVYSILAEGNMSSGVYWPLYQSFRFEPNISYIV